MFQFNGFCAALAFNTFISSVITIYSWLKLKSESGRYFAFLMLSITIWAFSATFELSFTTLEQKILWSKISYLGIVSVSPLWLLFVSYYARNEIFIVKPIRILIWIIPIIVFALAITNEYHGSVWPNIKIKDSAIGIIAVYDNGWAKSLLLYYSYILLSTATIILISFALRTKKLYIKQVYLLTTAAIFPWLGNALYFFRVGPFGLLDFTPIFFTITGVLLLWDILDFHLLEIMPVAYDTLFENMTDSVIVIDNKDRIAEINPAAIKLFNMNDSVGCSIWKEFDNYGELSGFIYSTQFGSTELMLEKDNATLWLDVRITQLINSSKRRNGRLITIRDITQRKKSEIELAESEKKYRELNSVKDRFIRIVSHDLKSPFQGMLGLSKMLAKEIESLSKDEIKEFGRELNNSIQNQYRLLEDLLSLSKVQSETLTIHEKAIHVSDEIKNLFNLFDMLAQSKHILMLNHINDEIVINADPEMFKLLLRNLISNALKFTQPGGTVSISCTKENNDLIFTVEDNGVGIAEKDIPKLFKLDTHHTTKGTADENGTGFGLVFCKEVIEKHNGKIWLESKLGKGTKFHFTFPE